MFVLKKSFDDAYTELKKAAVTNRQLRKEIQTSKGWPAKKGEGSRGGKVIGHTKSGKPVYDKKDHPRHKGFSNSDHHDAAVHNLNLSAKHMIDGSKWEDKQSYHEDMAEKARDKDQSKGHIKKANEAFRGAKSSYGQHQKHLRLANHHAKKAGEEYAKKFDKHFDSLSNKTVKNTGWHLSERFANFNFLRRRN